ncbi:MAG TPA: alkaline phosphatase family protein [Roseomonas sp.]|jgi:predicted AlkP superfamily pyrophosphatase or phosphodiesterase
MAERAVLILIDGLPADYVARHAARLPALSALAARGTHVARVMPAVPSLSYPGRAEMLTGLPPAANGVWGNTILDGEGFVRADPRHLAAPSIAHAVRQAGGSVASIGFGMVRLEDTDLKAEPWWRHLDAEEAANTKGPAPTPIHITRDPAGRLAGVLGSGPFTLGARANAHGMVQPQMIGLAADTAMIDAAAALLCGEDPPRLLLTEIATPDAALHYHGIGSAAADVVIAVADMLIGRLTARLEAAGRLHDTLLVVASDHGHSPIATALYAEAILGDGLWSSEGGAIHLADATDADRDALRAHGITALPGTHLPEALRGRVTTFVAPEGHAFERRAGADAPSGPPIVVATHGNAPGTPGDDCVAFIAGGGAERRVLPRGSLRDLAPTILDALGLPALPGTGPSLLRPGGAG